MVLRVATVVYAVVPPATRPAPASRCAPALAPTRALAPFPTSVSSVVFTIRLSEPHAEAPLLFMYVSHAGVYFHPLWFACMCYAYPLSLFTLQPNPSYTVELTSL